MLRNFYFATSLLIITCVSALAQTGSIKGKVLDKTTNEPLPFANVIVELNGTQAGGAQTDFDGNFTVKPLNPGKYDLKASFVGYSAAEVKGIVVSAEKITFQDIRMPKGAVDITQIDITEYKVPLIDKGNPSTQTTITYEDIQAAPTRDVRAVAASTAGVFQKDDGEAVNIRGSRDNATTYYVDGVKVRGSSVRIPQGGVEQVTVVSGGIPAQYGDNTGGVISIATRGPSKEYTGGIEYVTSELFDKYGYNLVALNLSGPLVSKKDKDGTKRPVIDFFLTGEFQRERDADPAAVPIYRVNDDKFNEITTNPLQVAPLGSGYVQSADYVYASDLERIKAKQNNDRNAYSFDGKFQFQLLKNLTLSIGGSGSLEKRHLYSDLTGGLTYQLFNSEQKPVVNDNTWRIFGRITQKFGRNENKEKSASVVKNAYYTLQVDYTNRKQTFQHSDYGDDYFNYGYIGKFTTYKGFTPGALKDTAKFFLNANGIIEQKAFFNDTMVLFTPGGANPYLENYTIQYYNNVLGNVAGNYENLSQVATNQGLINGSVPDPIYGIWRSPGAVFNLNQKLKETQFRISGLASADIKNHEITFGIEYEQRADRQFSVNPVGLWNLMRSLANASNSTKLNTNINLLDGDGNGDTIFHPREYNGEPGQHGFYESVREKLGISDLAEYVDIDSYSPDNFSLDLFTADELFNNGNPYINYFGYDHTGEVQKKDPSFKDFWTAEDEFGNKTRPMAAFRPIYIAGYIQDKFAINDLIFNVGVRVDRFDANQKVLKDKYSLFATRTAGEVAPNRPGNIGEDYVVYVSDKSAPDANNIVGYRDGEDWYDANGNQVSDPGLILQSGLAPWLVNPNLAVNGVKSAEFDPDQSFEDYNPQINIMPRIAFSFPISDEALFFAHYDILTQRPPGRIRNSPRDYYFLEDNQGQILNNPNLKPERTTDYELGFKQAISKSSSISISAFYRELKNMVQERKIIGAFPIDYITFDNFDFGTVKGLSVAYDLRRTLNTRLTVNYTLQFADGTGSGDRTSDKLIQNDLGNLRSINALDFDQRHAINVTFDFRYKSGADYNGPVIGKTQILSNMGLNVNLKTGSGTPYSAQRNITNEAGNLALQQVGSSVLDGSVNGSRYPWQFRIDAKLDKDINLKFGKKDKKKMASLNIYIQVQNLLNRKNVTGVYKATGVPDDDGYLAAAQFQSNINGQVDPQSYRDLYSARVNSPDNYSIPRRIRLGVRLDF